MNPNNCDKKCTLSLRNKTIKEIAEAYDSSQRAHSIHVILRDLNADGKFGVENKSFFESYREEIIEQRNNLAHCESKMENGLEILCTRKGDKTFSAEDFKKIRQNIAKYNKLFNKILQSF